MAGIEWALMLIAIPFYFFSKQILSFTSKYGPMTRLQSSS